MSNGRLRVKPFATESNLVQRNKYAGNIRGTEEDKENVPIAKNKPHCQFCGRYFRNQEMLTNHVNTLHSEKKPKNEVSTQNKPLPQKSVKCPLCKESFPTMVILMNHLTLSHYKQKFTCELCDLSFPSKEIFNLHVQKDHSKEVKEYKITKDKVAEDKVPEGKVVEDKVVEDKVPEGNATENDKVPEDNVAEDNVTVEEKVTKDKITDDKDDQEKVMEEFKVIEDPDCHESLQDLTDSLEHWCKTVNPSIRWCDIDGEMFQNAVDYGKHLQIAHSDSKIGEDFICDFVDCYSIFKSRPELKHHLRLVHSGVSFNCRQCPRSFSSQQNRSLHNQVEHLGVRFVCNLCKLDFKRRKNAFVHLLNHPENQRKGMNKPVVLIPIKGKKKLKPLIPIPNHVEEPKWEVVDLEKENADSPKPLPQLVEPKLEQDHFEEDLEEIVDDPTDLVENPMPLITTSQSSHLSQVGEKCETTVEKHSEEAMMQIVEPKKSQHFDQNPQDLPLSQVTEKESEGEKSMEVPNLPKELPNFMQFLNQNPTSSSITQRKIPEIEKETNRLWKCTHCSDAFVRKQTLENHIKARHLKIRDLKCPYCDQTFSTSGPLYMHKKKKHAVQYNMEKTAQKGSKLDRNFQAYASPTMVPTLPTVPLPMNAINPPISATPNGFDNRQDDQIAVAKKSTINQLTEPRKKAMEEAVKSLQSMGYMPINPMNHVVPTSADSVMPRGQKRKSSDNLDLEIQKLYQQAKAPSYEASPAKVSDPTTKNSFFFKCEYCNLSYATAGSLYMHKRRKHPEVPNTKSISQLQQTGTILNTSSPQPQQNFFQSVQNSVATLNQLGGQNPTNSTPNTFVQQSGTILNTSLPQQNSFPSEQNSVPTLTQLGGQNPYLNSYPSSANFFDPTAMALQEPNPNVNDANQVGDVADMVLRSLNYGAF